MSDDLQKIFEEAVTGIKAVKSLPYDDYANRLHNKVRTALVNQHSVIRKYIPSASRYPADEPDPDDNVIDIFWIYDLLYKLSIPSIASGLAHVDDNVDIFDLKQFVSNDNSKVRCLECITNLMGFCLGEHINRELDSLKKPNMEYLRNYDGFAKSCSDLVTTRSFILNEIRTDMARGDHLFSIAWLMIADYMQDRDHVYRNTPAASVIDFRQRASSKILHQWSYTLWGEYGKGNPTEMKNIVKFCGRTATIGLCPPNTTTNLQQPAPTWDVTKAFYDMGVGNIDDDDYNKELQDSLSQLQNQQEIVNQWKSYCMALTSAWEVEILQLWHDGMTRAYKAGEVERIKAWGSAAYNFQQQDYRWGDNYLPVTRDPSDGLSGLSTFNQSLENIVLPGTQIALSNGASRSIETICLGDKILISKNSNSSVSAFRRPIRQSLKADLVGFNEEKPWAMSSQVFWTTTGLRAADPEAAQRLNPYRRIGKLAIGHVLFRLQANEYVAVEIKSIQLIKQCLLEGAFTLSLSGNSQTYHAGGYLVDMNAARHTLKETVEMLRKVPGDKRLGLLSHFQELRSMFGKFDARAIYQRLNWELFGQYKSPDGQEPSFGKSANPLNLTKHLKTAKTLTASKGVPIDRLARGFRLQAHHLGRLPPGYKLPSLSLIDGYLLIQGEVQLRSTYDPQKRHLRWTRELKQNNLFEHGIVEICSRAVSGKGVIYLSSEAESQEVPPRDEVHPFEAKACNLDQLADMNIRSGGDDDWTAFGQWQVTLDQSVWPPDTERTEPEDPLDGGTFEDGYYASDSQVDVPSIKLLLVDQLRDQLNQKFGQKLGSFYDATSQFKDGEQIYSVQFKRAPLVPFISDAGLDMKKTFGVSFKSDLDIDITLPSLFQQMTFTMDAMYSSFTGYFYEYDPTKRGYKGDRHLIQGTPIEPDTVAAYRSKISRAYGSVSKPGEAPQSNKMLQPATVTEGLLALSDGSIADLVRFSTYDERSLHNDSQLLIHNMMYYHMDEDQRDKILNEVKPSVPDELPSELADNLPDKLKTFFKDKYGPAFISRYVGRTQKYMSSFTDQEMKNLWYWWQGNGTNSLSQSEEYNDINRLSSRAAMERGYKDELQPYLQDNPDDWAQNLYEEITNNKRLLNTWVHFPIQDGNNVVNKMCNVLDALSPSATSDWSQKFFQTFMTFALQQGATAADIEPPDQDTKYNWLHDSMQDLIVLVLSDDPSISSDVKQALVEDIYEFEKQNDLNQQADYKTRAAAIVEKSALFMQELAGWFSYIGKGLQTAFGGTALWKWVGQAFDQAAEKFTSLPGVGKLKGISSICMVGVSLANAAVSIWGLVSNWDTLSDAKRAVIILEVVRTVVGGVDKAIDAFKDFKSKAASTPADELNMEALNDGLADEISESSDKMGDIAQEITGDEDYRTAIAEGIHSDGVATDSDETWNEDLADIAHDVPPGYEDVASKFNISGNMLRTLNAILGIGLVIAMSFSLANDWRSLSDTGRVLGVLNVIVQGLTVLLDVLDVGVEVGLWAVTGTLSVALPILGAVLAVAGVILMIVQVFINFFVKTQAPPDPIAEFIKNVAHGLISTFDVAPPSQLTYSVSAYEATAGDVTSITVTGKNQSSSDVTLSHTTITLYSGDDNVCLFRNGADGTPEIALALDTDTDKDDNGHTYVTSSTITAAQLPQPSKLGTESIYYQYDLQAAGPPKDTSSSLEYLVLKAGESFKSVWTALVNNRGDDDEKSTSWIEVVEVGLKDTCQSQFVLKRI
ncbi:hypothetical protein SBOR_5580 [Sclerotinia borealis F-4128]|uniref:Uncharacterized protein n=1 Tax=Sclerotinia borealis (strain F-4128) TaxID=1432307 RepID=W9CH30_SCLBF|nr:hypothetical protein SBOR_5580 [Sclerotinia borealis F-4128]